MRWWMAVFALASCGRPGQIQTEVHLDDTELDDTEGDDGDCELEARIAGESVVEDQERVCLEGLCECASGPALAVWTLEDTPCFSELGLGSLWEEEGQVCFTPDTGGPYTLSLTCTDVRTTSPPTSFKVTVLPWDDPPEPVLVCPDQGVVGEPVRLFVDLECVEDHYSFYWTLESVPEGSEVTPGEHGDWSGPERILTGDTPGEYTVSVILFDGIDYSEPMRCTFSLV